MSLKKRFLAMTLGASILLTACGLDDRPIKTNLSKDDARAEVAAYYKKINPSSAELKKDLSLTYLDSGEELPDIDTAYPLKVDGNGQVDVEIFVSPEKAGSGKDGILIELAEEFNRQGQSVDGQSVSISVRSVPSGTAVDYISTKKHVPDGYTPSNAQWDYILKSKGTSTELVADKLFGNTSGFLMKDKVAKEITDKYGDASPASVAKAVTDGKLLGYTNPYSSSTGLSLLSEVLYSFDAENPISDQSRDQFQKFQSNIPSTFVTTTQLREAAKNGLADVLSISYQTYINTPEFSGYKYVPFGVRQDSPLYATTQDAKKRQVLKLFSDHVLSKASQDRATSYGFNQLGNYTFTERTTDGGLLVSMQGLWKRNKNSARPIVGVFVTDVSGSMEGDPMNNLKKSLLNSLQYINEDNRIGLVSYSDNVTINVPIAAMDNTQKAYFTSAIKGLTPSGGTATYDGTLVAVKMILDELEKNPGARPVIFVLSDGETNAGYSFNRLAPIIESLGITVNTIGYNADLAELGKLSAINESVAIDASSDDVVYKLKELFNAEF